MILSQGSRAKKIAQLIVTPNQIFDRSLNMYDRSLNMDILSIYGVRQSLKTSSVVYDSQTYSVLSQLSKIKWVDNEGEVTPNEGTKVIASTFIADFYRTLSANSLLWKEPQISASPDGEIVFEWWNNVKKLTIYCTEDTTEYIKVWGANIDTEMNDGQINSENLAIIAMWLWN